MVKNIKDKDKIYRVIALCLMFFAQAGLDIQSLFQIKFPLSIVFMFVIIVYTSRRAKYNSRDFFACLLAFFSLWIVYILKGAPMPFWVGAVVVTGYVMLAFYKPCPEKFILDLSTLCKWCMFYTLGGIAAQFIFSGLMTHSSFYRYYTILGLFWYSSGDNLIGFRFTGLAGEPGLWQLFLSMNLLFALYEKRNAKQIVMGVLSIIFMFSTTGYFNLLFVFGFYYSFIERKIKLSYLFVIGLLALFLAEFVFQGIMSKLTNSSGLTRISDIFIGWMFLKRSPLLGINPSIADNSSDAEFINLKYAVWGDNNDGYVDPGYLNSGFCSGIMWFVLDYGLPLACYYLYKLFKFPLIQDKKLRLGVVAIILLTFMTEPQSRTSWFYFFVLAAFIQFNWKQTKIHSNGDINNYSNV